MSQEQQPGDVQRLDGECRGGDDVVPAAEASDAAVLENAELRRSAREESVRGGTSGAED